MRMRAKPYLFFIVVLIVTLFSGAYISVAAIDCINDVLDTEAKKKYCEGVLKQKEEEAKQLEERAKLEQQNQQIISTEINKLTSEINSLKSNIDHKTSLIRQLSGQISNRVRTIETLEEKISREKVSLAKILRKQYETDSFTILEILLSGETISSFLADTQSFAYVQDSLKESFNIIRGTQGKASEEKENLESEKTEEEVVKYELEQNKKSEEVKKQQKDYALSVSEQTEQEYWVQKQAREAEAAIIRNKLFPLLGIQGGGIPFGEALQYANQVAKATGVRPALILAILKQESNLGKNVGTCNRSGDALTWRDIMPGPEHYQNYLSNGKTCSSGKSPCSWRDDQTTYQSIVKKLGLSTNGTPLSCPISSGTWGGAMGPSQFIPTTWSLYENRIQSIVGSTPNPWNAYHAITATALLMKDNGAISDPLNASCRYYSGQGCYAPGVRNLFYGQAVVQLMNEIQADIDKLEL